MNRNMGSGKKELTGCFDTRCQKQVTEFHWRIRVRHEVPVVNSAADNVSPKWLRDSFCILIFFRLCLRVVKEGLKMK